TFCGRCQKNLQIPRRRRDNYRGTFCMAFFARKSLREIRVYQEDPLRAPCAIDRSPTLSRRMSGGWIWTGSWAAFCRTLSARPDGEHWLVFDPAQRLRRLNVRRRPALYVVECPPVDLGALVKLAAPTFDGCLLLDMGSVKG